MAKQKCVLGIDPSLTGFAAVIAWDATDYKHWRWSSQFLGKGIEARMDRMLPLIESVMQVAEQFKPSVIAIEGYSYAANGSGTTERVEMGGILRADLITLGVPVHEVQPMTLKKFCTGSGKGDKTAMIACITRRWNVEFFDSDRYDAYGLARMALCLAELAEPENDAQRQAIETVKRGPLKVKGLRNGRR